MKSMHLKVLTLAIALVAATGAAAAETDLWLHVRVDEGGGAKVSVNLPMSLIDKAIPMIPQEHLTHGHVKIDDWGLTVAEMRDLWREVQQSPDATFVTVEEEDGGVRVRKEGGFLLVQVEDRDGAETVDIKIPGRVVDALLSGEGEELQIEAALEALMAEGEGELVRIKDRDDQVRVWIDRIAEAQ